MVNAPTGRIDGLLFDKDGTLFDFHATWSVWAVGLVDEFAGADPAARATLAAALGFDLAAARFRPESPIIAGTGREAAECVVRGLGGGDIAVIEARLTALAASAPLAPPVPLAPLLDGLLGRGLTLGVMTNDSEQAALAQLAAAGVAGHFHFVAGFDSGHGAKPDPGPLLAFARRHRLDPARVAMVGDSTHDLIAGRAAGMRTVAVLTGVAAHHELAPHADAVLPHIGHLPGWLEA